MQVGLLSVLLSLCLVYAVGRGVLMELDVETIPAMALLEADPVKGADPIWTNCTAAADEARIDKVIIEPNPPQPGKDVTITATVELKEEVTSGEIKAVIKVGIFHKTFDYDLCKTLTRANQTCPLPAGTTTHKITVSIPSSPELHVTGTIRIFDQNRKELSCFKINLTA